MEPPALDTFSMAIADARYALIVSALVSSPSPRIFTYSAFLGSRPLARSASRSTVAPASNTCSSVGDVDRVRLDAERVLEAALRIRRGIGI